VQIRGGSGSDAGDTDAIRFQRTLAICIGMAGDRGEAARRLCDLADLSASLRGAVDGVTLRCRSEAAHWIAEAGDVERGVRELRETLTLLEITGGPFGDDTRTARERLELWSDAAPSAESSPALPPGPSRRSGPGSADPSRGGG
jgi:hypothetical protein